MITVGLDFGTHQTKVCIEDKEQYNIKYQFFHFEDTNRHLFYTFPSIIGIGVDGLLTYGYLPHRYDGQIIRYFKKSVFRPSKNGIPQEKAMYYATWYIAYILFDLEKQYGQEFSIQMGAPTDSNHVEKVKEIATRIIASAYHLVENVFANDKTAFLATPIKELTDKTKLVAYSKNVKDECGLLVFPEAYACLMPLISQGKLDTGMNLMIDIGGGTTDISFFTIEDNKPQVYDFYSINKGLNYLTEADKLNQIGTTVNIKDESEIIQSHRTSYTNEINQVCNGLINKLQKEFKKQTSLNKKKLTDALKNRPLVYCGGGSTFNSLRKEYRGFNDIKQISHNEWDRKSIIDIDIDIDNIIKGNLCPILSTAYGLAISRENDDIVMSPFRDIFKNIRVEKYKQPETDGKCNYYEDWDTYK